VEWQGRARRGCRPTGRRNNFIGPPSSRRWRWAAADPMAPSGASGSPSAEGVDSDPTRVRYLAFLLDDVSRCSLLDWVAELSGGHPGADDDGWSVHADHVTVAHRDAPGFDAALASFPWGMACEMRVLGIAGDARARAVHVEVPDFVPQPAAEVPHVTVACAPDARAVESGAMLVEAVASGAYLATSEAAPLTLTGRLGGVTVADARVFQPPQHPPPSPPPRDHHPSSSSSSSPPDHDEAPSGAQPESRRESERERVAHLWRQLDALATTATDDDDGSNRDGSNRDGSNRGWLRAGAPGGYLTVASRLDASRDPVPANRDSNRRDSNRRRTEQTDANADATADGTARPEMDALAGMFPGSSRETLAATLAKCDWDANRAAERVLFGEDAADARARDADAADDGVDRLERSDGSNAATVRIPGGSWAEAARARVAVGFRWDRAARLRDGVDSSHRAEGSSSSVSDEAPYVHAHGMNTHDDLSEVRRRQAPKDRVGVSAVSAREDVRRAHDASETLRRSRASISALSRAAYARGDGAEARRLSLRAAAVAAQMETAKARAAAAAIRLHNRADDAGVRRPPLTVDLHGLTAEGATAVLRTVLAGAARTDARAVRVVCGAGRHSVGGRARVAPAVRGFLEDEGVRFVDEGGGTLTVPLETR
jgi:DNA-nicking Smr family endonuclease